MADHRTIVAPQGGPLRRFVGKFFPERQIIIRDQGRIRCVTLRPIHQIMMTAVIAGCVLWALLASAAYLDGMARVASKDDEIAQRTAELNGVKANYQAAFNRLDEFQTIFAGITCEITDIQDTLLKLAERNTATAKGGPVANTMPRLSSDANGCRAKPTKQTEAGPNAPAPDTQRITGRLGDAAVPDQDALSRRAAQLEDELAKLQASHGAFLTQTANLTATRIAELEKALATAGVDQKILAAARHNPKGDDLKGGPFGQGGPFIAARPGVSPKTPDGISPVALFNSHADRLDSLTAAIHALPLGEPLDDYEVTSPFGARNDPINAMTGIHEGVDLGASTGTPVVATGDGEVISASWHDRYGIMVEIEHGMGVHTRYAHLAKVLVNVGQHVTRGTPLGLVGVTGRSTGPHLHYEVRVGEQPTNPMKFIMAGQNVLKGQ